MKISRILSWDLGTNYLASFHIPLEKQQTYIDFWGKIMKKMHCSKRYSLKYETETHQIF